MHEIGFLGFHFSIISMSSSKWLPRSKLISFAIPFWLMVNILSEAWKSPKYSPLCSTFKRLTVSSNQIFRAARVDMPTSFSSIFLIGYLDTKLPFTDFPLIFNSAKLISIPIKRWIDMIPTTRKV